MNAVVKATNLGKRYGSFVALEGATFEIPLGRVVGVIGANGAGKTTMLNAILGLAPYEGDLEVMGLSPAESRSKLMEQVCFISDVATLPRWMRVRQILDYVDSVHEAFDVDKCLDYLSRTKIPLDKKIKGLSKGMVTQLHLAIVMSIDAKLLVLDEPTLGLDIIFRKNFYRNLIEDYFDHERTIIVTTHQVEEIESILTDVMFIKDGRVVLYKDMDTLSETFFEVTVAEGKAEEAMKLSPVAERSSMGRSIMAFEGVDRAKLKKIGEVHAMDLSDIFVVKMTGEKQ